MESYAYKRSQRCIHKIYQRKGNHIITVIQLVKVKRKRRGNNPSIQSVKDEFYINFSRKCIKYLKWWLEHKHMNSTHPTLYFRYEEETKWSVTLGEIRSHKERSTYCNINDTWIFGKPSCIHFWYSKIDMFSKNYFHLMGSNPHLLKDMQIYI